MTAGPHRNIFCWTAQGADAPEYLSANTGLLKPEVVTVTMRGWPWAGKTADGKVCMSVEIPRAEFDKMLAGVTVAEFEVLRKQLAAQRDKMMRHGIGDLS